MADVTELITRFGFEGSANPLNEYNVSLGGSIKLMAGFVAGAGAVAAGILAIGNAQSKTLQTSINLAKVTGISAQNLQELRFAASGSNSSAEALDSTLESLSATISDVRRNGPSGAFAELGLSTLDANGKLIKADELLFNVGKRFKELNFSVSQQVHFADALGIDSTLLGLIGKSSEAVKSLIMEAREYGLLTDQQIVDVEAYNASNAKLEQGLNQIKNLFAVGLLPEMSSMSDWLQELLKNNKELIQNGLELFVEVTKDIFSVIKTLMPLLKVFAGIWVAMHIPVLVVVAAILLVILAIEDLFAFAEGKDSIIGDIFGVDPEVFFGKIEEMFDFTKKKFEELSDFINGGFGKNITGGVDLLLSSFSDAGKTLESFWTTIFDAIIKSVEEIVGMIQMIPEAINKIGEFADLVGDAAGNSFDSAVSGAKSFLGIGNQNSSSSNNITNHNTFQIKADNPKAISNAVEGVYEKQLRTAGTIVSKIGGK